MKRAMLAWVTASVFLAAGPAFADAVAPPPTDCPAGSQGDSCHGGPYCAPIVCTKDADCQDAGVCTSLEYCATTMQCGGGWSSPDGGPPPPTQVVTGLCADGCDNGVQCSTLKVCAPAGTTLTGGCSCDVVGGPAGAGALLSALVAAAALVTRRRRRG